MFRYDDFVVGKEIGAETMTLGPQLFSAWARVFPEECQTNLAPPGMIAVVTMRAFTTVVAPRPPGNVHGSQSYEVKRLPRAGEVLTTRITCLGKEIKRGRRWVYFGSETSGDGDDFCFGGRMAIAWAS